MSSRVVERAAKPMTKVSAAPPVTAVTPPSGGPEPSAADSVSPLVRETAAWSWRLLVIGAAGIAVLWLVDRLVVVVVPVALAIMLTALLVPVVDFLDRRRCPRGVAVALVLVVGLSVMAGVVSFVVTQFAAGAPGLVDQVTRSIDQMRHWLIQGPPRLSAAQINNVGDTATQSLRGHQEQLTSGVLATASTVTEIVTGAFLALFTVIFLLLGGRAIWEFVTRAVPVGARERVRAAGGAGFHSLTGYVRATFVVALFDAVGIGCGLAIMGVPLALPLASLVFLGAFVPVVGALVSGLLAVVVALLTEGVVSAAIVLVLIVVVMQIEAHVLQPLVMGRAVSLHPLAVVLGTTAGSVLAGIVGALLAVPLIAFVNSACRVLLAADPTPGEGLAPEGGGLLHASSDDV